MFTVADAINDVEDKLEDALDEENVEDPEARAYWQHIAKAGVSYGLRKVRVRRIRIKSKKI